MAWSCGLVLALLAAATSPASSAKVIVAGDSWGTTGRTEFANAVAAAWPGATVDNIAIGGSTANQWAQDHYLLSIFEAIARNRDATHLWLTVGGNDASQGLGKGIPLPQIFEQMITDTSKILTELARNAPHIHVVQWGYDIPNSGTSMNCLRKAAQTAVHVNPEECTAAWNNVPNNNWTPFVQCSNAITIQLQTKYVDVLGNMTQSNKWNYTAGNMMGALQYWAGNNRAQIGKPDMSSFGPDEYWLPDCTHLQDAGYAKLFPEVLKMYFGAPRTPEERVEQAAAAAPRGPRPRWPPLQG